MRQAGVGLGAIEGIAVGRGPGSYTGLRVGIAAGLGLARGLGIPITGVDTLKAVALRHQQQVTVVQCTRNELCYTACYLVEGRRLQVLSPPQRTRLAEIQPSGLMTIDEPPSGQALSALGSAALEAQCTGVEPLYL